MYSLSFLISRITTFVTITAPRPLPRISPSKVRTSNFFSVCKFPLCLGSPLLTSRSTSFYSDLVFLLSSSLQKQTGGGMMSGLASTIAQGFAFGTGSAVAHRVRNNLFSLMKEGENVGVKGLHRARPASAFSFSSISHQTLSLIYSFPLPPFSAAGGRCGRRCLLRRQRGAPATRGLPPTAHAAPAAAVRCPGWRAAGLLYGWTELPGVSAVEPG